jgi:hypothetical protein
MMRLCQHEYEQLHCAMSAFPPVDSPNSPDMESCLGSRPDYDEQRDTCTFPTFESRSQRRNGPKRNVHVIAFKKSIRAAKKTYCVYISNTK